MQYHHRHRSLHSAVRLSGMQRFRYRGWNVEVALNSNSDPSNLTYCGLKLVLTKESTLVYAASRDGVNAVLRQMRGQRLQIIGLFLLVFPSVLEGSSQVRVATSHGAFGPASEPIAPTFLSVGATPPSSDNLPCFDCVEGESSPTIGIAMPVQVVTSGEDVTFTLAIADFDFTGACSVGFELVLSSGNTFYTYDLPSGCTAGTNYLVSWQTNMGGLNVGSGEIAATINTSGPPVSIAYNFRTVIATVEVPVILSIATAKPTVPGVAPCLNCVTGATSPTAGLPRPLAALLVSQEYQVISMATDASFTGTCGLGNAVRQNGLIHSLKDASEFACSPGLSAFAISPLVVNQMGGILAIGASYTVTDSEMTLNSHGNYIEIAIW